MRGNWHGRCHRIYWLPARYPPASADKDHWPVARQLGWFGEQRGQRHELRQGFAIFVVLLDVVLLAINVPQMIR